MVEDDPDLRQVEVEILESAGYEVAAAGNGREALDAVERDMPRLILLDMLMPTMDGWEFARRFHERHGQEAVIVVVTAAEHAASRAAEIGAAEVVGKPFDLDVLLGTVDRLTRAAAGRP